MSRTFLNSVKPGAIRAWTEHKILPSITGAQAALEGGWGTSALAKPPYNNQFGIKSSADWTGRTVPMQTREFVNGSYITITASFRAYDTVADSVADHGAFFTSTEWRRNNYRHVVGETDYKKAAQALQNAGYATDPNYASSLIRLIEQWDLQEWDKEALSGGGQSSAPTKTVNKLESTTKIVGDELTTAGRAHVASMAPLIIGDDFVFESKEHIQSLIPSATINSARGRDINDITSILRSANKRDPIVIVGDYNNDFSTPTRSQIKELVNLGGNNRMILLQADNFYLSSQEYRWASSNNENVYYAPFGGVTHARPELLNSSDDSSILSNDGRVAFGDFLAQALYEMDTGDTQSRTATDAKINYYNIGDIELNTDGIIKYKGYTADGEEINFEEDIGITGLYSPLGDKHIYNRDAQERWGIAVGENSALWLEGIYENSQSKDGVALIKEGSADLLTRSEPSAQYTISLLDLPEDISIGDTGEFLDHHFNPPLYIRARVIDITESETNPSMNKVTIGNVEELFPRDKSFLQSIQRSVDQSREELLEEWRNGEPITAEIESTNGLVISNSIPNTKLVITLYQGSVDVSDRAFSYVWSRSSVNSEADFEYNSIIEETEKGRILYINQNDIETHATFTCRVYNERSEILAVKSISLDEIEGLAGKDAYELAVEEGFEGSLEDWLESLRGSDGDTGESVHTAWAYDDKGTGFTTSNPSDHTWVGFATSTGREDPQDWRVYDWMLAKGEKGDKGEPGEDGKDGLPGKDGVGIKETDVTYAQSASETSPPETGWSDQVSTLVKGNYLWTKTVWTYTDTTTETGYSVSYIAKDGNTGDDGQPGKDGVGITDTIITYAKSTSGTNAPASGYTPQVPSVPEGQFLWTKTEWKYTDGTNEFGYSVSKIGEKGDTGEPGEPGKDGENANSINLLLNGDNGFSTTSYQVAEYTLTEDFISGETYTMIIKGSKKSSQSFTLYQNGGSTNRGNLTEIGGGMYQITFTSGATTEGYHRTIRIYQPPSGTVGQANIEWATLVQGAIGLKKFVKSPEQLQGEIDNKASNSALTGVSNEVGALTESQKRMQENMEAYLKQQEEYNQWLQDVENDAKKANELADKVNNAQVDIQTELNDQARKWVTQEGFIQFDGATNSISIASESKNTQMIIDDEALGFYSGGTRVAAITNQYLQIDRGIFTKSAQMGNHKFEPLASNPDHFILSYVKGGNQ